MFDAPPSNLPVEPAGQPVPPVRRGLGEGGSKPPAPPSPLKPAPIVPPSSPPPISKPEAKPLVPPSAFNLPFSTPKEPEDIFSELDLGPAEKPAAIKGLEAVGQKSFLKPALIGLGAVILVTAAGFLVWFLLIRPEASPTPTALTGEETVLEQPPPVEITEQAVVESPPPITQPPEGAEVPLPQPISPLAPPPAQLTAASDTDSDGLTDAEEALFGTNAGATDSDGDGYSDLTEIQNGYDPAVPDARLADSIRLRKQILGEMWEILLPAAWSVRLDEVFPNSYKIDTGVLASLSVKFTPKPAEMVFADWLAANEPAITPAGLNNFTTRRGYAAAQTSDRLITFLFTENFVITLSYVPNGAATLDFPLIYDFFVQNLDIVK